MNWHGTYFRKSTMLIIGAILPAVAFSAPVKNNVPVKTNVIHTVTISTFTLPASPAQGRDPFFPNSKHPYEKAIAPGVGDVSSLEIRGFVEGGGRRMAIINNHTFAAGDEGDVLTSKGRLRIHCIEIKGNLVVIEVDGQRHELNYHNNP
jgi:hypothetical protein